MQLVAGELFQAVLHISARALARQALSLFCDDTVIMAGRTSGCALLGGSTPLEVMELGVVSHIAAFSSSLPFVHWFDGARTSSTAPSTR